MSDLSLGDTMPRPNSPGVQDAGTCAWHLPRLSPVAFQASAAFDAVAAARLATRIRYAARTMASFLPS